MQPDLTEVNKKAFHSSSQDPHPSSQYGYHDPREPAVSLLQNEDRAVAGDPPPARQAGAEDNASIDDSAQDSGERQRRLSATSSKSSRRTGSPVDRIIEHEQTVVSSPKRKNDGPAFTIIGRKSPRGPYLILTDFPNGKVERVRLQSRIGLIV